jgi:integrase
MNSEQELAYLEDSTNYMNQQMYQDFKWGLYHLEPFTSETGRPPMNAFDYVMMSETQFGLGERITETLNHIPEDFDLDHRIAKIWNAKTGKGKYQKTTIPPYLIETLRNYLKRFSPSDQIWPINRQNAWRYYKDAGRLAGLNVFEENELHDVEGVFTHLFRKSCSKRMALLGASRELRMLKLRHSNKDAHDAYDKVDINALLKWEWEHLQPVNISQRSLT